MRPLSTPELLDAWDRASGLSSTYRTLSLLGAAWPDAARDELARLSVGERDKRLLMLRERVFGPRLTGFSNCKSCAERLEFSVNTSELIAGSEIREPDAMKLAEDSYEIDFRLPNSLDLIAAAEAGELEPAIGALRTRCILSARHGADEVTPGDLPDSLVDRIATRMNELDPQADIRFAILCPACGDTSDAHLDIESFFWAEINAWAMRILGEVHVLACAYGWREIDILGLSASRRQYYINLVSG